MLRNIRDVFFSKIPPSMNNFRSFVEEDDHMVVGSLTPNLGEGTVGSKEKIDIEMGSKLEENNYSLPEILRNLDFDNLEDSLKMEERGRPAFDPLSLVEQDEKVSVQICIDGDGAAESEHKPTTGHGMRDSERSSNVDGVGKSVQSSTGGDETNAVEKADEVSDSSQNPEPVLKV